MSAHKSHRKPEPPGGDRGREAGMTLVEVMVALFVVVVVFFGFSQAMTGAIQTSRDNALGHEGTIIALDRVELARGIGWEGFALSAIDPQAPLLAPSGQAVAGAAVGLDLDEPLVVSSDGSIASRAVEVRDGTTYTVWSYVTSFRGVRRLIVDVRWQSEGNERSFQTSTLVAEHSWG